MAVNLQTQIPILEFSLDEPCPKCDDNEITVSYSQHPTDKNCDWLLCECGTCNFKWITPTANGPDVPELEKRIKELELAQRPPQHFIGDC
jgi:hypothetical protein